MCFIGREDCPSLSTSNLVHHFTGLSATIVRRSGVEVMIHRLTVDAGNSDDTAEGISPLAHPLVPNRTEAYPFHKLREIHLRSV